MNTSICPVRRSSALKLLPDTRPAYGSYLSQSISLVAPLNTPENVSSVRLMKGPSASRTNLLVEALWIWAASLSGRGRPEMRSCPPQAEQGSQNLDSRNNQRGGRCLPGRPLARVDPRPSRAGDRRRGLRWRAHLPRRG